MTWHAWAQGQLDDVVDQGRWRAPVTFDASGPTGRLGPEGRAVVAFASNDYLGLSRHPAVVAAAHAALDKWGSGAGASRLITGSRPVHAELEAALAAWKGTEAAVCFPTGFAASLGVLSTLGTAGTWILSDELNHASLIDGSRLARARVAVYRHADVQHLETQLAAARREGAERCLVVSDSVFSMDGDVAPLAPLFDACRRHRALLVLDEAHAVLGPELPPVTSAGGDEVPVLRVGTLSKTLGALGGFVAAPRPFVELLVNRARPYIFTTALSPPDAAAARAALAVLTGPEGPVLKTRLAGYVERLRPRHQTPIVPVVLGSEQRALAAAAHLLEQGLWVPAIRPPTVPPGTSRLRVTVSAGHAPEDVERLARALEALDAEAAGASATGRR